MCCTAFLTVVGVLLWLLAGKGRPSSLSDTYRERVAALRPELVRLVRYRYPGLADECEDAVHDALLDLLRNEVRVCEQVPTPERLVLYARRVALNKAHDLWNRKDRVDEFPDGDPEPLDPVAPDDPARESELRELHKRIEAALLQLPKKQADAVRLYYFAGLNCAEIAQVLGTSKASVTRLLCHGRRRLAELLSDERDFS